MDTMKTPTAGRVMVTLDGWENMQSRLQRAIDGCNDVVAAIAAHNINGKYDAEDLLDMIEGLVREVRKLIEATQSPI